MNLKLKIMVCKIFLFSLLAVALFLCMLSKRARNEIMDSFKTNQARLILII